MSAQNAPLAKPVSRPANNDDDTALLSAVELVGHYRTKALSPVEVTQAILNRIERLDRHVNAFAFLDGDSAIAAASAVGGTLAAR